METAHYYLIGGETIGIAKSKVLIEECEKAVEKVQSVDSSVFASFYRVTSQYHKTLAHYSEYYKNALLYLACIDVKDLPSTEIVERAHDLAVSALLGEAIFNFGELLMHPILDALNGTSFSWLRDLLFVFNAGDIEKFEAALPLISSQHSLLATNMPFLRQKICLMALIEVVFKKLGASKNHVISFAEISLDVKIPINEVEYLIMKALSMKLIKGIIDEVDQVIRVNWVQPRVLDRKQIGALKDQLALWEERTRDLSRFLLKEAPELMVNQ